MTNILFCYDNRDVCELLAPLFDKLGKEYKMVDRFSEAIRETTTSRYDIIFLDILNDYEPNTDACHIALKIRELQPESVIIGLSVAGFGPRSREYEFFDEVCDTTDFQNREDRLRNLFYKYNL